MMKKLRLYSGILLVFFGCSTGDQSKEVSEAPESQEAPVAQEEETIAGPDVNSMDLVQLLSSIPTELLQHEAEENVGHYFDFIKERGERNGLRNFHKTDNYWAFGYHREDKDGFYDIDRLRMWRDNDRVIIGWTDEFEHEKFGGKEQIRNPTFFVFEKGKWSRYPVQQFLPVAFITQCFFSPYDDRILVYTSDEEGETGQDLVAWRGSKFEIDRGGSPFMTYDFQNGAEEEYLNSSRLSEEQLSTLNDYFEKGTSLRPIQDLIFPKDFARFAEKKIGNSLSASKIELKPIVRQTYPKVDVYVFSMSIEAEARGGDLIFFRSMKNGEWISEVSEFDGSNAGAVPEPFNADWTFNQSGFDLTVEAGIYFMAFPDMWFGSIDIPWEVKAANEVTRTYVQVQDNGKLDKFEYDARKTTELDLSLTDELQNAFSDERARLDAYDQYLAIIYEQYTEGEKYGQFKLTPEQQLQAEIHLNQLYREATGSAPMKKSKTFFTDSASIVAGLRSLLNKEEPKIQRLVGDVFFYEGDEYSVLFNTLTMPSSPGDYFDDAFDQFKSRFYNKFDMVQGSMEELPDLTGDGQLEFLLKHLGGYHSSIDKTYTVYSLDARGVFTPLVNFNTTFEGGQCETPLGTDFTLEAKDGALVLTSEVGQDNRPPGEVIRQCESRFYQGTYRWDSEAQALRRISFQEIDKP